MPKPSLYDMNLADLETLMRGWGQPAFRARQIYRQLYVNLAANPAAMTDLPLTLRDRLSAETSIGGLRLVRTQTSDDGLTRKALFALPDGVVVETVLMIYADRATACVSTQAGCAMGCVFCATGKLGLLRNLSPGEIVEQALWASRELRAWQGTGDRGQGTGDRGQGTDRAAGGPQDDGSRWVADAPAPVQQLGRISNLVFMGMGEPLANYDRWWESVQRLHDPQGLNMGARSMTVSTVGLAQGIRRLAGEGLPINLAISLHAPDDALRSALMPINDRFPIGDLLDAAREYIDTTGRRVSFEYVLLQGQNDQPHQALALAKLLRGHTADGANRGVPLLCHVNLIPWNPVPGAPLGRSEHARVRAFQQVLVDYGVACTVRVERGVEIAAACGQLAGANDER
ncbi:radical SAM protein [Oscillochloris sp. ZM17-4]|uniref:radical SAM protein n=1 Tax=Oscillochloris sp. ZM17-4 TaxID=2866714 RepID=UPI001C739247|nr:radical SAM protein [Oscillochloris sp. ZM17-4]MBX0329976.1 radical SAM protein [Oscillochloris sp. ZM17-4]